MPPKDVSPASAPVTKLKLDANTAALDNLRAAVAVADAADAAAAAVVADGNAYTAAAGGTAVDGVASTNIGIRAGVKAGPLDLGLTFR